MIEHFKIHFKKEKEKRNYFLFLVLLDYGTNISQHAYNISLLPLCHVDNVETSLFSFFLMKTPRKKWLYFHFLNLQQRYTGGLTVSRVYILGSQRHPMVLYFLYL